MSNVESPVIFCVIFSLLLPLLLSYFRFLHCIRVTVLSVPLLKFLFPVCAIFLLSGSFSFYCFSLWKQYTKRFVRVVFAWRNFGVHPLPHTPPLIVAVNFTRHLFQPTSVQNHLSSCRLVVLCKNSSINPSNALTCPTCKSGPPRACEIHAAYRFPTLLRLRVTPKCCLHLHCVTLDHYLRLYMNLHDTKLLPAGAWLF
jgi:hypothetical protein